MRKLGVNLPGHVRPADFCTSEKLEVPKLPLSSSDIDESCSGLNQSYLKLDLG